MKTKVSKKTKAKKIFAKNYKDEILAGVFDMGRGAGSIIKSIYDRLK